MNSEFIAFGYPLLYLDIVVLACLVAMFCLLAIRAGADPQHWFVRAGTIVLALLALLPIQAHQPSLMLTFVLPPLAATAMWLNGRGIGPRAAATPRRLHFSLGDLLKGVLLAGLVCYGATVLIERRDELDWPRLLVGAPSIWLYSLLCYLLVFGRRGRIAIGMALVLAIPAVAALELWCGTGWSTELSEVLSNQGLSLDMFAHRNGAFRIETLACQLFTGLAFCLLLTGLLMLTRASNAPVGLGERGLRRRVARGLLVTMITLNSLAGLSLYWQMIQPSRFEYDDPSLPNSYARLCQIGQRIEALNPGPVALSEMMSTTDPAHPAKHAELAALYTEGLRLSRQPGHVPFNADDHGIKLNDMQSLRGLARAWYAEGNALAKQGDLRGAAGYHESTVDVGAIVANRGLIVHCQFGFALEGFGISGLTSVRQELPPDLAKSVLTHLGEVDRERERYEIVAQRDRQWVRAASAWRSRFGSAIETWGRAGTTHPGESDYRFLFQQRDAKLRLLIADLAVRLHRSEQGSLPADLRELVPRYLPSVAIDPYSGAPIIYRPQGDDFLVYCVGRDGKDDGGRFGTRLDADYRPGFDWGLEFLDESPP